MKAFSRYAGWERLAPILALLTLAGCSESDAPDDDLAAIRAPAIVRIVPASEALAGAHIPTLDPATMRDAEIQKALGKVSHCEFRYTSAGRPVLAWQRSQSGSLAEGVVKLNGHLVILSSRPTSGEVLLAADKIRLSITPDRSDGAADEREAEATAVFEIASDLKVGYRGYYKCAD